MHHSARRARFCLTRMWLVGLGLLWIMGCSEDPTEQLEAFPPPDPIDVSENTFPLIDIPTGNPTTVQGVALGRRLFYEPRLSGNNSMSCATCHQQEHAFSDGGRRFSLGIDGSIGTRNTPTLTNPGFNLVHFWDGRALTLEEQALGPVTNPIEMNETWDNVVGKLRLDDSYPVLFGQAFGSTEISADRIVKAIAQFERTLISKNSRYDRWLVGQANLTDQEIDGFNMFFSEIGDCFHCHDKELFTTRQFHDIGLDLVPPDVGRSNVTHDANDVGKFKAPTLRNLAFTAPYMHDGRFATLSEVLNHYNGNAVESTNVDPLIRVRVGLGLSEQQKQAIIAFILTLSDSSFITNPNFSPPSQ